MPTTVVKTIKSSGGDYSTGQAWEDACPANLVSDDKIWEGQYAESTFVDASVIISGTTTDSTRFLRLTTATGCSYRDTATAGTTDPYPTPGNGAQINSSSSKTVALSNSCNYTKILNLGINGNGFATASFSNSGTNVRLDNCVLLDSINQQIILLNCTLVNCYISSSSQKIYVDNSDFHSCFLSAVNSAGVLDSSIAGTASSFINCWIGQGNQARPVWTGVGPTPTFTTCVVTYTSPPSGCTTEGVSSTFTNGNQLQSTSICVDGGTNDSSYTTEDAVKHSRPQGAAWDVGPWEYTAAGAAGASLFYIRT